MITTCATRGPRFTPAEDLHLCVPYEHFQAVVRCEKSSGRTQRRRTGTRRGGAVDTRRRVNDRGRESDVRPEPAGPVGAWAHRRRPHDRAALGHRQGVFPGGHRPAAGCRPRRLPAAYGPARGGRHRLGRWARLRVRHPDRGLAARPRRRPTRRRPTDQPRTAHRGHAAGRHGRDDARDDGQRRNRQGSDHLDAVAAGGHARRHRHRAAARSVPDHLADLAGHRADAGRLCPAVRSTRDVDRHDRLQRVVPRLLPPRGAQAVRYRLVGRRYRHRSAGLHDHAFCVDQAQSLVGVGPDAAFVVGAWSARAAQRDRCARCRRGNRRDPQRRSTQGGGNPAPTSRSAQRSDLDGRRSAGCCGARDGRDPGPESLRGRVGAVQLCPLCFLAAGRGCRTRTPPAGPFGHGRVARRGMGDRPPPGWRAGRGRRTHAASDRGRPPSRRIDPPVRRGERERASRRRCPKTDGGGIGGRRRIPTGRPAQRRQPAGQCAGGQRGLGDAGSRQFPRSDHVADLPARGHPAGRCVDDCGAHRQSHLTGAPLLGRAGHVSRLHGHLQFGRADP